MVYGFLSKNIGVLKGFLFFSMVLVFFIIGLGYHFSLLGIIYLCTLVIRFLFLASIIKNHYAYPQGDVFFGAFGFVFFFLLCVILVSLYPALWWVILLIYISMTYVWPAIYLGRQKGFGIRRDAFSVFFDNFLQTVLEIYVYPFLVFALIIFLFSVSYMTIGINHVGISPEMGGSPWYSTFLYITFMIF